MNLEENRISQLIIENKDVMYEMVSELFAQIQGSDGSFVLSDADGKELKLSKTVDCILEPVSLKINNKRNITQLFSEMSTYCNDTLYDDKHKINSQIVDLLDNLSMSLGYNVEFDLDILNDNLFKAMNVKFSEDYENLKEKIIQYISVVSQLNQTVLLVFVNLSNYVTASVLTSICEYALGKKVNVLLIEASESFHDPIEKSYIIDNDLCIIEL